MSVFSGPEIVNNGMVFNYDMSNTQKSWKGKPTTNVIQTNLTLFDKDNGCTVTQLSETFEGNPIYRVVFPSATLPRIRTTFSYTTGQQFTGSIYYKVVTQGSDTVQLYFRENGFGTSYINTPLTSTTWQRASISYTFSSSGTSMFLIYQSNLASTAPTTIDFSIPQTELGSYATPFINGTRTTSNNVIDLTGTNTITANSLTYYANNTFSFDGSSNYMEASGPGFASGLSQYTIMHWSRMDTASRMPVAGRLNTNFYQYGDSSWRYTHGGVGAEYYYPKAVSIPLGTWGFYCFVYDGTQVYVYRNGVFEGSQATTGTADWSQGLKIGNWSSGAGYAFNGLIGTVAFYNRALSAEEVQQNFNANRGRFNI